MQRPNPPISQGAPMTRNNHQNYRGPPPNRSPLTGANITPVMPKAPDLVRPPLYTVSNPITHNPYQQQRNASHPNLQDSRTKSVKRPHPINPSPQAGGVNQTDLMFHPPPSQEQYPQSSYPPYPQSFWTTPPPGDGPPTAWSTDTRSVSAGLPGTSAGQTVLPGSSAGQTGLAGRSTGHPELTGYPH